jgi:hypothetical protein
MMHNVRVVEGEVVVEFPPAGTQTTPVTRVRSTLVTSSITALRARGLFDAYASHLASSDREALVTMIAGNWIPVALALKHYGACEALALTHDEAQAMGLDVATRVHASVLNTVRRLATGAGVTPWTVIGHYNRLWTRLFDGGAYHIIKTGPKDAVLELFEVPLVELSYFRSAFCGVNQAGLNLFSSKVVVRALPKRRMNGSFAISASWV